MDVMTLLDDEDPRSGPCFVIRGSFDYRGGDITCYSRTGCNQDHCCQAHGAYRLTQSGCLNMEDFVHTKDVANCGSPTGRFNFSCAMDAAMARQTAPAAGKIMQPIGQCALARQWHSRSGSQ
jgi:hypothetical protein